jgi:Na+/H+ antiporter NhaD/arsenite permease-like protein
MPGIPLEFVFFGLVLAGVALLHKRPLAVALTGLAVIVGYKLMVTGFAGGAGWAGLSAHLAHEWVVLANLMLLLVGFAVLSNQFERSNIPDAVPALMPDNWTGGLALLGIVFLLSALLDNIASAVIGGVMARHLYKGQVGLGFLVAIVASANAGGAGSVLGDTTTTMMWISGISPVKLLWAFVASVVAFLVFAPLAAWRQQKVAPVIPHMAEGVVIDWVRASTVLVMLVTIVTANVVANSYFEGLEELAPLLGLALWAAILVTAVVRKPDWKVTGEAIHGALFLVALVGCASLMPVEKLPDPSWVSVLGLGFLSAAFDNIPLTALALQQGGYDWAMLAYAVGFGGSMVWFGSSAGVALSNLYPETRSVVAWIKEGWMVAVAYLVGFGVMLALLGWNP